MYQTILRLYSPSIHLREDLRPEVLVKHPTRRVTSPHTNKKETISHSTKLVTAGLLPALPPAVIGPTQLPPVIASALSQAASTVKGRGPENWVLGWHTKELPAWRGDTMTCISSL